MIHCNPYYVEQCPLESSLSQAHEQFPSSQELKKLLPLQALNQQKLQLSPHHGKHLHQKKIKRTKPKTKKKQPRKTNSTLWNVVHSIWRWG